MTTVHLHLRGKDLENKAVEEAVNSLPLLNEISRGVESSFVLEKGQLVFWHDPDDGLCSGAFIVKGFVGFDRFGREFDHRFDSSQASADNVVQLEIGPDVLAQELEWPITGPLLVENSGISFELFKQLKAGGDADNRVGVGFEFDGIRIVNPLIGENHDHPIDPSEKYGVDMEDAKSLLWLNETLWLIEKISGEAKALELCEQIAGAAEMARGSERMFSTPQPEPLTAAYVGIGAVLELNNIDDQIRQHLVDKHGGQNGVIATALTYAGMLDDMYPDYEEEFSGVFSYDIAEEFGRRIIILMAQEDADYESQRELARHLFAMAV